MTSCPETVAYLRSRAIEEYGLASLCEGDARALHLSYAGLLLRQGKASAERVGRRCICCEVLAQCGMDRPN